jgi:hypothetical protein
MHALLHRTLGGVCDVVQFDWLGAILHEFTSGHDGASPRLLHCQATHGL